MSIWRSNLIAAALLIALSSCSTPSLFEPAPPMSIEELRGHSSSDPLRYEKKLDDGKAYTAYLISYRHSGLRLFAMVAVPKAPMPESGFPVVIANHGYVPEPRKYGIRSDGRNARPGDYYSSVPELFTSRGFLVVLPDYRGHNTSDGFEFIDPQDDNSIGYFAEDVVALVSALNDLRDADLENVFMWAHSMGGPISMRTLLATDIVRATALWSTMSVDDLQAHFDVLTGPMIIHHATGDHSTDFDNSSRLSNILKQMDKPRSMYSYDSDAHYFDEHARELAADRDARLFRACIAGNC